MVFHTNIPQYKVNEELIKICEQIIDLDKNGRDWYATENSDEFQTKNLCGGFEEIEQEFCFSYYEGNSEYWFQFSIEEAKKIVNQELLYLDMQIAQK